MPAWKRGGERRAHLFRKELGEPKRKGAACRVGIRDACGPQEGIRGKNTADRKLNHMSPTRCKEKKKKIESGWWEAGGRRRVS